MQRAFFPQQTFISESADKYTKQFQEYSAKNGAEAATAFIESYEKYYTDLADKTGREARYGDGLLNRWLGFGDKQIAAKTAAGSLEAIRQARGVVLSQIENDTREREQQALRDAELAEQQANQKKKELDAAAKKAIEAAKKQRIADRRAVIESIDLEIAITEAGTDKMLQLRQDKIEAQRQLELEQNRQKTASERQDEAAINAKYDKQRLDAVKAFNTEIAKLNVQRLQAEQQAIQLEIAITEDGTERMLELRLANIEKQREIEIEQNRQKDERVRQAETAINAKYDALRLKESADFNNKLAQRDLAAAQDLAQAEFDLLDRNERQKTLFKLQQEKARLEAILKLNETATKKMTADEIAAIKATIAGIEKQTKKLGYNNLYELLGINLDSDQQSALNTAIDSVKDSIGSLVDSWNAAAEAAVNAANAQVEAAQRTLDAEIEARNAGYANEVETAQKELELAKKNQEKALKEQQKAQKAQLAADSIEQASSLVTASANIWKSLSGIPVWPPPRWSQCGRRSRPPRLRPYRFPNRTPNNTATVRLSCYRAEATQAATTLIWERRKTEPGDVQRAANFSPLSTNAIPADSVTLSRTLSIRLTMAHLRIVTNVQTPRWPVMPSNLLAAAKRTFPGLKRTLPQSVNRATKPGMWMAKEIRLSGTRI